MNIFNRFYNLLTKGLSKPIFSYFFTPWGIGRNFTKRDYYYGIVYRCMDAIAVNIAAIRFHLVKIKGDKKEIVNDHPALNLLYKPNKFQTGYDIFYLMSGHLDGFGRSAIYPVKNGNGEPVELYILEASRLKPVPGKDNLLAGYIYLNPKGEKIPFEAEELIEIKRPNPFNQIEGISTIEMAQYEIEGDINAVTWNKNFFEQGAMPSGVLSTDQNISEDTFNRLKKQWQERYQGKENAHKPMILEAGLTWTSLSLKQKDMDFIEQRRYSRDQILSIFNVPKSIVGITDDVNRANAETAEYVFAKRVIEPRLRLIFDKLNRFYLPLFKGTENMQLRFEDPVPENVELKIKKWEVGLRSGFYKINEVRSDEGKEPVEGGDEILVPFNLVPLTTITSKPMDNNQDEKSIKTKAADHTLLRDRVLSTLEGEYRIKLDELYRKLTTAIRAKPVKKIKKDASDPLVNEIIAQIYPDMTEWEKMFATMTFDLGVRAMQSAVEHVVIAYGIARMGEGAFKKAIDWLKKRVESTTADVTQTLYNRAREIIARNLADQIVDIEKIRNEVADVLDDERFWRVERVVRTELFTAYSEAEYRSYKESGTVERLKWIAAADERTCPICMGNHLKVVKFGKEFPSGHTHTPAHIQCRCSSIPTTDELT